MFSFRQKLLKELKTMDETTARIEACHYHFRQLHDQYEAILNAAPDAMVVVDRGETIVLANREAARLFGYGQDEMTGRSLSDLIPERYRAEHHGHFQRFFGEGRSRRMGTGLHIAALKKDGTEFPVDISLSLEGSGDEGLVVAAVRDMTAHKEATIKLKLNFHIQRVISSVLSMALSPVAMDKLRGAILDEIVSVPGLAFQSKGAIYLVEEEPEVLVMKAHQSAAPAQLTSCVRVPFGKCLCGMAARTGRVVFVDSLEDCHEIQYDGIVSHGHYCVPIVSGDRVLGLISIAVHEGHKRSPQEEQFIVAVANTLAGVIERKEAEKALQISEEKYRTLVEHVNVGVYRNTGGPEGRFLQANPALARMLGYDSVEEVMQCSVAELYQNPEERAQVVSEILEKGFIKDREVRLRKKDGSLIWASVTAIAKSDEHGQLQWFDGVIEDATERKAAEFEKQALLQQLTEAEKLAALGRLTQNIAHEIRNPLTAVGGFARRLVQG
ncbi:MAG: PAS domain S-box protein, partial [bacterium]|nr:PAS domain S-box protein [bacterium]